MHGVAAIRDDRDMKPGTPLAIVLSVIFDRDGGFPIEVRYALEGEQPLGDIARVLIRIERDARPIYRYSG
jgi:hypothetical protein